MILIRIIFVSLAVALSIVAVRPALSEYFSKKSLDSLDSGLVRAAQITGEHARYHYLLGIRHYTARGRAGNEETIRHYRASLARNPTDAQTWLALARVYDDDGMKDPAVYAVKRALTLDRNNPVLVWESGVRMLAGGRVSDAMQIFRRYISMLPGEQENVYSLCFLMGINSRYILERLVPDSYDFHKRYLFFLLSNRLLNESLEAWERTKSFDPERDDYVRFVNFLIDMKEMRRAGLEWGDLVKKFRIAGAPEEPNLIWNSDFESPLLNGGFDWRIGRAEGVRIFRDQDMRQKGYASLGVSFSGKTNPGVEIASQIVPVEPGRRYRFSGYLRTEKLTTRNGIVFEAVAHHCAPFVQKTETVTGTNRWKKLDLDFTTPKECTTIKIGARRERSQKFDSRISGDAWIDSLVMVEDRQ